MANLGSGPKGVEKWAATGLLFPEGGIHNLRMDGGLPPVFQKATLFQLPLVAVIPTFMMNFGGKLPIFDNFLPISGKPNHV